MRGELMAMLATTAEEVSEVPIGQIFISVTNSGGLVQHVNIVHALCSNVFLAWFIPRFVLPWATWPVRADQCQD